jgi:NTP pyrophosphatase (non-canonical NTP hydrolase)
MPESKKLERLTQLAAVDLFRELGLARAKFPKNEDLLAALAEEVGELAQALLHQKHEPEKGATDLSVRAEAIQVACVALRIASEGDAGFPYNPELFPGLWDADGVCSKCWTPRMETPGCGHCRPIQAAPSHTQSGEH